MSHLLPANHETSKLDSPHETRIEEGKAARPTNNTKNGKPSQNGKEELKMLKTTQNQNRTIKKT
jgi:hypothetical protein